MKAKPSVYINIDTNSDDVWLAKCMHIDVGKYLPRQELYSFRIFIEVDEDNPDI